MKKKVTLDAPRSPSLWPEKKITEKSALTEILASIPDYIERAREGILCAESRCDRASKKDHCVKLSNLARSMRDILPKLEEWRKEVDSIIASKVELF